MQKYKEKTIYTPPKMGRKKKITFKKGREKTLLLPRGRKKVAPTQ